MNKDEIAIALGIEEGKVKELRQSWRQLMKSGVICRLHIRRWRAKTTLDLEDLGLPKTATTEETRRLLTLGEKLLLPPEYISNLQSIEVAWRKALEANSFDTVWGKFIPATNFASWRRTSERYAERYKAICDIIVAQYDDLRDQIVSEYRAIARDAYERARKLSELNMDEKEFVSNFVTRIAALLPTKEYIEQSFGWDIEYFYIPLPDMLNGASSQPANEAVNEAVAEMNRAVMAEMQEKKEQMIDGFLRDVIGQLRRLVYDAVLDISESIQKNGKLHHKSIEQAKNLLEKVMALNIANDREVELIARAIRAETTKETVDPEKLRKKLADVAKLIRSTIMAMYDDLRVLPAQDFDAAEDITTVRRRVNCWIQNVVPEDIITVRRPANLE